MGPSAPFHPVPLLGEEPCAPPDRRFIRVPVSARSEVPYMPATATKASRAASQPSPVQRVLASGKTSLLDIKTGRMKELHAPCPTDGAAASVRRVTRENGGSIMEVTLRCPRCYADFVAPTASLYLS